MMNMYDFISGNASAFAQQKFDGHHDLFIDYHCPITENKARVWTHKNCLMYVLSGKKGYGVQNAFHESEEHQVLFARKGGYLLHQRFEKPYRALIFMFDDLAIRDFFTEFPVLLEVRPQQEAIFMAQPAVFELGASRVIQAVFTSSLPYLQGSAKENSIVLGLRFKELLTALMGQPGPNAFRSYLGWVCSQRNLAFVKLVRENCHANFTVAELARMAGMSESTFKRVFVKNFGSAPGKWLRQERIAQAIALLSHTDKSISEIAFELGYNDVSAFAKAFKSVTQANPSSYRKS